MNNKSNLKENKSAKNYFSEIEKNYIIIESNKLNNELKDSELIETDKNLIKKFDLKEEIINRERNLFTLSKKKIERLNFKKLLENIKLIHKNSKKLLRNKKYIMKKKKNIKE